MKVEKTIPAHKLNLIMKFHQAIAYGKHFFV